MCWCSVLFSTNLACCRLLRHAGPSVGRALTPVDEPESQIPHVWVHVLTALEFGFRAMDLTQSKPRNGTLFAAYETAFSR